MIAKRTVLVVDNEAGTRESLRWMLKANYQVRVAENPLAALNMMEQEPMDMVLSDILMEPFDGITLLQKIKAKDKAMPVVMMTAPASTGSSSGSWVKSMQSVGQTLAHSRQPSAHLEGSNSGRPRKRSTSVGSVPGQAMVLCPCCKRL